MYRKQKWVPRKCTKIFSAELPSPLFLLHQLVAALPYPFSLLYLYSLLRCSCLISVHSKQKTPITTLWADAELKRTYSPYIVPERTSPPLVFICDAPAYKFPRGFNLTYKSPARWLSGPPRDNVKHGFCQWRDHARLYSRPRGLGPIVGP